MEAGAVGGVNIYNAAINSVMLPQAIAYYTMHCYLVKKQHRIKRKKIKKNKVINA